MDELFSVRDKTVLITGGSSGLGLQLVRLFMRRGAKVCSVALGHDDAIRALLKAEVRFHAPVFVDTDLSNIDAVEGAFTDCETAFGPPAVVINNAGLSIRKKFLEMLPEDWDGQADINLRGLVFTAQAAAKRMAENGGGSIINMSSMLAGKAMTGTSTYSATKAAVNQLTRSMAFELGPLGIRVNAIAPGWFETHMTSAFFNDQAKSFLKSINPSRRLGEPGDLDGVALLLASDAGRYINGAVITVDGGQSL